MKQLITLFFILGAALLLNAQPKIEFKNMEHDFGNIKEDKGMATTNFEFKNTGNQPLIVNNAKASCGCTTPEWTKEPIAPGKTGSIKVSYNPQNRPGQFTKNVSVYSNAQPSVTSLTIKGNVEPKELTLEEKYPREMGGLRFKTNYMSFGTVLNNETKTDTLEFINNTDKAIKIGTYRTPEHITVSYKPETIESGKVGKMIVKFDASKKNAFGYVSDRVYLNINDQSNNEFSVGISVSINEDFSKMTEAEKAKAPVAVFENTTFDFGTISEGDVIDHNYKLTNTGKTDLIIRNVKASCGCTAVKHEDIVKPGATTELKVQFNSRGKKGRQNKSVTVITNDPNNSTTNLRVMGTVNAKAE